MVKYIHCKHITVIGVNKAPKQGHKQILFYIIGKLGCYKYFLGSTVLLPTLKKPQKDSQPGKQTKINYNCAFTL